MYRTKIELTILSEDPIPDEMDVDRVIHEAYSGDFVMTENWLKQEKLSDDEMAAALTAAGSDPGFFQLGEE